MKDDDERSVCLDALFTDKFSIIDCELSAIAFYRCRHQSKGKDDPPQCIQFILLPFVIILNDLPDISAEILICNV